MFKITQIGLTYDFDDDDSTDAYEANIKDLNIPHSHMYLLNEAQELQLLTTKKAPPVPTRPNTKPPVPRPIRPDRPPQPKSPSYSSEKDSLSQNTEIDAPRRPPPPNIRPSVVPKKSPAPERPSRPSRPPRPSDMQQQTMPISPQVVSSNSNIFQSLQSSNSNEHYQNQDYNTSKTNSEDKGSTLNKYPTIASEPNISMLSSRSNDRLYENTSALSQLNRNSASFVDIRYRKPPPVPSRRINSDSCNTQGNRSSQFERYDSDSSTDDDGPYNRPPASTSDRSNEIDTAQNVQFKNCSSDSSLENQDYSQPPPSQLEGNSDRHNNYRASNTPVHADDSSSTSDEDADPKDYQFETIGDTEIVISALNIENDDDSDMSLDVEDHELQEPTGIVTATLSEHNPSKESDINLDSSSHLVGNAELKDKHSPLDDTDSKRSSSCRPVPAKRTDLDPKPQRQRPVPVPRPR